MVWDEILRGLCLPGTKPTSRSWAPSKQRKVPRHHWLSGLYLAAELDICLVPARSSGDALKDRWKSRRQIKQRGKRAPCASQRQSVYQQVRDHLGMFTGIRCKW